MTSTAIARIGQFTPEQKGLIKTQIMPGSTDDEVALFLAVCQSRGLDPFRKQIYAVSRYSDGKMRWAYQVSIEGLLGQAERTKERDGFDGPHWCAADGVWRDTWLSDTAPVAAKMAVFRKGHSRPYTCTAQMAFYQQFDRNNNVTKMWAKGGGAHMLGKCALALALRLAFPEECGGLYTDIEMKQADLIPEGEAIDAEYCDLDYLRMSPVELGVQIEYSSVEELNDEGLKKAIRLVDDKHDRDAMYRAWDARNKELTEPASPAELACSMCGGPIASGTRCSGCSDGDEVTS